MTDDTTLPFSFPAANTPEQFDAIIRSDAERYRKLLQAVGVTPR